MRRHAFLGHGLPFLLVPSLLITVACGPSNDPPGDAGIDAGVDAPADSPLPDGSPPDGATDGAPDAPEDALADQQAEGGSDAAQDAADADADSAADAEPDAPSDAASDAPPDAPYPPACGDGYRDITEECDDGLGTTSESRACTGQCQVVDRLAGSDSLVQQRWLGSSSAVASGATGHAIALVEQLEHPNDLQPRVTVVLFDMAGRRLGISSVEGVDFDVAPAIAALPDGDFALVVSQMGIDSEGLGLGLYRIPASGGDAELIDTVNESTAYGQHGPTLVWDGSELVVAWLDDSPSWNPQGSGRRVCVQRFDQALGRLGVETCFDEGVGWPSDLTIAAGSVSTAVAWRELRGYDDVIVVEGDGWSWESEALAATSAFESPALGWIDGQTLLVVATEGEGSQRAVVLEAGVEMSSFEVLASTSGLPRFEPSVAVTADGIYLAWSEPEEPPDGGWLPTLAEVWLQKLVWTGTDLDSSAQPMPLPREAAHQNGDQHRPLILPVQDPSQPAPGGALLCSWNDLTASNYLDQAQHGDVVIEVIPTPVVRGPVY